MSRLIVSACLLGLSLMPSDESEAQEVVEEATLDVPGSEGFGRVVDVEVLSSGEIVVLDGLLQEIHLFER